MSIVLFDDKLPDGVNGMIVPPWQDHSDYATTIARLRHNDAALAELAEVARDSVKS